jgi:hypothetical protein
MEGEVKMIELKGSEKQIIWAEKIRESIINLTEIFNNEIVPALERDSKALENLMDFINDINTCTFDEIKGMVSEDYNKVINSDSSKELIEMYKDCLNTKEVNKYFDFEKTRKKDTLDMVAYWYLDMITNIGRM